MEKFQIKAQTRKTGVRSILTTIRKQGYVPAVVYGKGMETIGISVSKSDIREIFTKHGKAALLDLDIDGKKSIQTIIKDVQFDMLKNDYLHIDFQRVSMDEKIEANVPLKIVGKKQAEKSGGLAVQHIDEITIKCLPKDMVEYIEADVSKLGIGDNIKVSDLNVPESIDILTDPDEVILTVTEPQEQTEDTQETDQDVSTDTELSGE